MKLLSILFSVPFFALSAPAMAYNGKANADTSQPEKVAAEEYVRPLSEDEVALLAFEAYKGTQGQSLSNLSRYFVDDAAAADYRKALDDSGLGAGYPARPRPYSLAPLFYEGEPIWRVVGKSNEWHYRFLVSRIMERNGKPILDCVDVSGIVVQQDSDKEVALRNVVEWRVDPKRCGHAFRIDELLTKNQVSSVPERLDSTPILDPVEIGGRAVPKIASNQEASVANPPYDFGRYQEFGSAAARGLFKMAYGQEYGPELKPYFLDESGFNQFLQREETKDLLALVLDNKFVTSARLAGEVAVSREVKANGERLISFPVELEIFGRASVMKRCVSLTATVVDLKERFAGALVAIKNASFKDDRDACDPKPQGRHGHRNHRG